MNPSSVATEMREVKLHDSRSEGNRSIIVLGAERAAMMKVKTWTMEVCVRKSGLGRLGSKRATPIMTYALFWFPCICSLPLPYLDYCEFNETCYNHRLGTYASFCRTTYSF